MTAPNHPRSALSPNAASPAEGRGPLEELAIGSFILAMASHFERRAALTSDRALIAAVHCLDAWEGMGEQVELTKDFAQEIVDSELEHWEAE